MNSNLSQRQFPEGSGLNVTRIPAEDPELDAYEGQKATLIEGPRRWHGTLARHWQTGRLGLHIGAKTRRNITAWERHQVDVGPDAKYRYDHWKAHSTDAPPGPDCPQCRRLAQG